MMSVYDYLAPSIPNDNSNQSSGLALVEAYKETGFSPKTILDLGCGVGTSLDVFRKMLPGAGWTGVDIEASPEVNARTREDGQFVTYDGINLPFEDGAFDLIYSHQVFEHVRHPEDLLDEVKRVLAPGGLFIGQTSHLEPYHSYSIFNFTPYGWKTICEAADLNLKELRPCIDGVTLTKRSFLGRPAEYNRWFAEESPLNAEISDTAKREKLSHRVSNFRKLNYCGQFSFVCEHGK